MKYDWVKVSFPTSGGYRRSRSDDIHLTEVTVLPSEIDNILIVIGHHRTRIDSKLESEFSKKTVTYEYHRWDPRRLFGWTEGTMKVPDVPASEGWQLDWLSIFHNDDPTYFRMGNIQKTLRIPTQWVQLGEPIG